MTKEQETLISEITTEITNLSQEMTDTNCNMNILDGKLKNRLSFLKWVNTNWKLRSKQPPTVVKQGEIFFCQLGENIGSEQNGKRPVIIIQNNIGNSKGSTTIVVPITTYENSQFFIKDGQRYMSYQLSDGSAKERKLDFYEVELKILSSSKYQIHGIANVVHMREVSKKRLSTTPVAIISEDTYTEVVAAIHKNISKIG